MIEITTKTLEESKYEAPLAINVDARQQLIANRSIFLRPIEFIFFPMTSTRSKIAAGCPAKIRAI